MKPVVNRLEEEYKGRVDFRPVNIDEAASQDPKTKYSFIGQPQFVVLGPKGEMLSSRNGMQTYDTLKADIEAALAAKP